MFGLLPAEASEPWDEIPRLPQASVQERAYRDSLVHPDLDVEEELRRATEANSLMAMTTATVAALIVASGVLVSQLMSEDTPLSEAVRSWISALQIPRG